MRSTLVSMTLGVASVASAMRIPQADGTAHVHLDDLVPRDVDYPTLEQDANGRVPYFGSEEYHLSAADTRSVEELLQGRFSAGDSRKLKELFCLAGNETHKPATESGSYTLKGPDNCKVYPGDAEWPSSQDWEALNAVTNDALLKPTPQSHVCYGSNGSANSTACQDLTARWQDPFAMLDDPIEMLTPIYQGMTCQPPSIFDQTGTCDQGGYPLYVVNVTNVAQVQLAVNFARNTGVRLVIKNTGHDFLGKSGGAGSLSVWTHNLKEVAFIPSYEDSEYSGPAIKAGVGIQGFELYAAADSFGVIAMGGECPTVGTMGGWILGGGHSPVTGLWGMGADHVLGLEVVTADGQFVTANKDQHSDLFWALRGGGGGTFGIVTSVITRVFHDVPVTTATWDISGANVSSEAFEAGLKAYFETFPSGADNGIYSYFLVFPGETKRFAMQPYFAPNKTLEEAQAILSPWLQTMEDLNIPVNPKWSTFDGFYDAYNASFPVENVNANGAASGARLFPRANFENETLFDATWDVIWEGLGNGVVIIGYNMAPTYERGFSPDNAVNPAWRDSIGFLITGTTIDLKESAEYQLEQRHNFTNGPLKKWRDLTPGGGTYMSESDYLEPNFQWSFYGSYYPRLLEIKQKYDPYHVFYAHTGVGSEFFEVRTESGLADQNGKLCVNDNPTLYVAEGPDYEP